MSTSEDLLLSVETVVLVASLLSNHRLAQELKKAKAKKPDPTMCACKHTVNYHDEEGCRDRTERWTGYDKRGNRVMTLDPCSCARFVGPNSTYDPGLDADVARAAKAAKDAK